MKSQDVKFCEQLLLFLNEPSQTVATIRIAPKSCQGQPPHIWLTCSRSHPNRFTFGGVVAERVEDRFCPVEYLQHRLFEPIISSISVFDVVRSVSACSVQLSTGWQWRNVSRECVRQTITECV